MSNGIKMSDCRFYVDEEARVIICVIPHTRNLVKDFIQEHFEFPDVNMWAGIMWAYERKLNLPHSFMGKAVCAPEDEWNEELGKMIAFSRAKNKAYTSFFKRANNLVQTVDRRLGDMITMFNDFGLKLETKREALEHQIDELSSEK